MLRLGESIRRCGIALLLLLSLCPLQRAHAVIGTMDAVPAATLLYPYFEVDLSNANGKTTLIGVHNTSASAALARVTIWSNTGVPVYNFNIYLTGYDSQSFDMRSVLLGNLPQTASAGQDPTDVISPKGTISQDINFASCTGQLPYGPINASFVADLQAMLTGKPSTIEFAGQCVGTNSGDNVARGYLTIDSVVACSTSGVPSSTPGGLTAYFTINNYLDQRNILLGDYTLVNPSQNVLIMNNAASIESSPGSGNTSSDSGNPQTTVAGNYTFYGRFVNWTAADHREALPSRWMVTGDNGNGSAIIWRDPKVSNPGGFSCGAGQPGYAPLGMPYNMTYFDRASNPTVLPPLPTVIDPFPPPLTFAPVATQIAPMNNAAMQLPASKMGFIDMNLNTDVAAAGANPPVGSKAAQSLVVVLNANKNQARFSTGTAAVQIAMQPTPSLVMTSNNRQADNVQQDIATVTLMGTGGQFTSVSNVTVTVAAPATIGTNTCSPFISNPCTVAITSATPGSYAVNVTATLTDGSVITLGPQNAVFTGAPNASSSLLFITTNNVLADGASQDVAQVTVKDASSTPVGGVNVTFTAAAPANLAASSCMTDALGQCTVGITSSTAGNFAINVTAPVAVGPQNATFLSADATQSTLTITTNNRLADGISQDIAQVVLKDATSNPINGATITFSVAAPATLVNTTCTTDLSGACSVGIRSSTAGSFAVNVTAPVAIGPQNAVFGTPSAAQSTLVVVTNNKLANGNAQDIVQLTLHDASNQPLSGVKATFTVAPPASFFNNTTSITCFTDNSGQCSVSIRSSTAGSFAVNVTAPVAVGPQNVVFLTPSAAQSTLAITTNSQTADGVALDVAQVTLNDASNVPINGANVSFSVAAGATFTNNGTTISCQTNTSGQCTVSIKSSTPGSYAVNITAPVAVGPQNATFVP